MSKELTLSQVKTLFPKRDENANKGDFGYIALIGGCVKYSGAIRLAEMANAAMRSGAGVCTLAVPSSIANQMIPHILESTIYPLSDKEGYMIFKEKELNEIMHRHSVIAFGMGIGNTEETRKALIHLLRNYEGILIVDADGINAMSKIGKKTLCNHKCKLIITPHPKEFSRLSKRDVPDILNDKEGSASKLAEFINAIVLLKGHVSTISDGETTYTVEKGCAGMATAGSGDVLSGIIAAVAANNRDNLLLATAGAAYVNGVAGEIASSEVGEISQLASDTANAIPKALKHIIHTDDTFEKAEHKVGALFSTIDASFEAKKRRFVESIKENKHYIYTSLAIIIGVIMFGVGFTLSGGANRIAKSDTEISVADARDGDYVLTMEFLNRDIYIDGHLVNNYELYRPVGRLDDKIYIPLSEEMCKALGITANWKGRHPSDIYIKQASASHEGIFYSKDGWNLKDITGWAKKDVVIHIGNGSKEIKLTTTPNEVISYNDGEVMYIPIAFLKEAKTLDISTYYDPFSGLYISTDKNVDAESYFSENNLSYITARAEYIQSFLTNMTVGDCLYYEYVFRHEATVRDISEDLLITVARTESKFNRHAVSAAGALGMMQIMPDTAKSAGLNLEDLFEIHESVQFGATYIKNALTTNKGDLTKALSVYNFGGGAVTAGNYDTYYANTVISRLNEMQESFIAKGYSNEFLTVVECTK